MTAAPPLGALRHRLTGLEAGMPAPVQRIAPSKPPSASRVKAHSRLTGLAFRLYAFLSAHRRKLLPFTTRAAGLIDRRLITASTGAVMLRFTARQLEQRPALGAIAVRLLLVTFAATAQIDLAASRKPSAMRAVRLLNLIFRAQRASPAWTGAVCLFQHTGALQRL